ncbi:MAG: M1 family aminopeptidase [Fimbriimonadaceae bacterium]
MTWATALAGLVLARAWVGVPVPAQTSGATPPLGATPEVFLGQIRDTIGGGVPSRIERLFARREDSEYLAQMARRRGGWSRLRVAMIPAPPGIRSDGPFWVVIHTRQDIQEDRDTVFAVIRTGDGWRLGREVAEYDPAMSLRPLEHAQANVRLTPASNTVQVRARLKLRPVASPEDASRSELRFPVFRLGDPYRVLAAEADGRRLRVIQADDQAIAAPSSGDLVRAGSLMILWDVESPGVLDLAYEAVLRSPNEDKVDDRAAYVTAWWIPAVARLPHTWSVAVTGPAAWTLVSEGVPVDPTALRLPPMDGVPDGAPGPGERQVGFRCELPISYPKVVGGPYVLAAEIREGDRVYRSFQFEPVEPERARRDVERIRDSVRFFEDRFGPWPFPGYDVYDADTYYGIESYSYTLLQRRITTRFVSHEVGHTYFGGIVPCTHTRDSWNEGVTQYVDSVLFDGNRDRTLQAGLASMRHNVPLSRINVPHSFDGATYMRGAYAMRMLEREIGLDAVLAGLRAMVADRKGKDTIWADLRPYFEASSGRTLAWFWRQWIDAAQFPELRVVRAEAVRREGRHRTFVTVRQSGTDFPYRLRFQVEVRRGANVERREVVLEGPQDAFAIDTDWLPEEASVQIFELTLARTAGSARVLPPPG